MLFSKVFSLKIPADASKLLEKIAPYPEMEIGMAGHYWLALYSFLVKNNYVVHVVNPIQTDSWRNSTKIRPHKNRQN